MAQPDPAAFTQLQLALANAFANPSLSKVLTSVDGQRSSLKAGDDLVPVFARSGAPLPEGIKASLEDASAADTASGATIVLCVSVGGFDHCARVTIRSPFQVETS